MLKGWTFEDILSSNIAQIWTAIDIIPGAQKVYPVFARAHQYAMWHSVGALHCIFYYFNSTLNPRTMNYR